MMLALGIGSPRHLIQSLCASAWNRDLRVSRHLTTGEMTSVFVSLVQPEFYSDSYTSRIAGS